MMLTDFAEWVDRRLGSWQAIRETIIALSAVTIGTVILAAVLLLVMAVGGVWGPGWVGDVIDWIRGR